jgi:hypothetical protein
MALSFRDQSGWAASLVRRHNEISERMGDIKNASVGLRNLSNVLRFSGALHESEVSAHRALLITRQLSEQGPEAISLYFWGLVLAVRGIRMGSAKALNRSLSLSSQTGIREGHDGLAMLALWSGEFADALRLAKYTISHNQGRGPFKLFHSDAYNVMAQIERDAGNHEAAAKAATEAYLLAWCDGPPFAYHWGLQKAKAHLAALGVPEPMLPPFDESKYEPMPQVEIDPSEEDEVEIEP